MVSNLAHFLTAQELADLLHISRQHVYNLMKTGLPSVKIGNSRRFDWYKVRTWLNVTNATIAATPAKISRTTIKRSLSI